MSNQIDSLVADASAAHASGRLKEAEDLAKKALEIDDSNTQANLLLAVILAKTGRDKEAFPYFENVIRIVPASFEANFWLSILHRRGGDLNEAVRHGEIAAKAQPRNAYGLNNLGLCYLDQLQLERAAESFRFAGNIRPDMAPIFHNLGTALYMLGRDLLAAKAFEHAITLSPRSIDSMLSLGQTLISQTNPSEAAKVGLRALAIDPNSAAAHLLVASALVEDSRSQEAEPYLSKAVELDPADAKAQALLGLRLQSLGRFKEANQCLRKSLELDPKQGFAYFALVHNNKIGELDPLIVSKMEDLAQSKKLPPREKALLEYGLGRALENLGSYAQAIHHFDEANALSRRIKLGDSEFDQAAYIQTFDLIIEKFTEEFVQNKAVADNASNIPIVIVGMMRSGTTLIEQILSSHPQIGAAGEQRFWPENRGRLLGEVQNPATVGTYRELGKEYVARLTQVAGSYDRVTDKMPANFELAGAIHMSLPNAKIIHMRRHPVDTCISIYTTPNRVPVDFAYNRANIVLAYQQYRRLMAHWRKVIPSNRLLEINYEELVQDRVTQLRKIVDFLELDWHESLLHHESNERNVITPSLWQVRQPVYTSSMERWRRYEPWLGEFRELLEPE